MGNISHLISKLQQNAGVIYCLVTNTDYIEKSVNYMSIEVEMFKKLIAKVRSQPQNVEHNSPGTVTTVYFGYMPVR